jgi:hypothetical protein
VTPGGWTGADHEHTRYIPADLSESTRLDEA